MAMKPRRQQILSNQNLVGTGSSGNSGNFDNLGRDLYPNVTAVVEVTGTVTGTTPTLDIYVEALMPSGNYAILYHFTQIIATTGNGAGALPVFNTITNVMFSQLRVRWVVGGTSPVFNGVYCDLYFASPSA